LRWGAHNGRGRASTPLDMSHVEEIAKLAFATAGPPKFIETPFGRIEIRATPILPNGTMVFGYPDKPHTAVLVVNAT